MIEYHRLVDPLQSSHGLPVESLRVVAESNADLRHRRWCAVKMPRDLPMRGTGDQHPCHGCQQLGPLHVMGRRECLARESTPTGPTDESRDAPLRIALAPIGAVAFGAVSAALETMIRAIFSGAEERPETVRPSAFNRLARVPHRWDWIAGIMPTRNTRFLGTLSEVGRQGCPHADTLVRIRASRTAVFEPRSDRRRVARLTARGAAICRFAEGTVK